MMDQRERNIQALFEDPKPEREYGLELDSYQPGTNLAIGLYSAAVSGAFFYGTFTDETLSVPWALAMFVMGVLWGWGACNQFSQWLIKVKRA